MDLYDRAIAACPELDSSRRLIHRILCDFADVFSKDSSDVGRTHLMQHSIPVAPNIKPIRHASRRLGPEKAAEVDRQVQQLADQSLIEPSNSAWSSPVVLVKKKDGSWRLCVDLTMSPTRMLALCRG